MQSLRSERQETLEQYRQWDIESANRSLDEAGRYACGERFIGKVPLYPYNESHIQDAIERLMIGSHVGRCG